MADTRKKTPVVVLTKWLNQYAGKPNTHRSYEREFRRIQNWLLRKRLGFVDVTTRQLSRYLMEFASGKLAEKATRKSGPRSHHTVMQAKDVLNRIFRELQWADVRPDNPASSLPIPEISTVPVTSILPDDEQLAQWHELRKTWYRLPDPEIGARDPFERSVVIAEFAYWVAMSRSELANATMADFRYIDDQWDLALPVKGRSAIRWTFVSDSAMLALTRYRLSRGLPSLPQPTESNVPLISRLRVERNVDPWTIAQALKALPTEGSDGSSGKSQIELSSTLLRRYLIALGITNKLSERDLRHHVRSNYAVNSFDHPIHEKSARRSIAILDTHAQ